MGCTTLTLSEVVLKVQSLCDLSCGHCYGYEAASQSWRSRRRVIAYEVVAQAGGRLAEHAVAHGLSEVQVVLHGGELLLAGGRGVTVGRRPGVANRNQFAISGVVPDASGAVTLFPCRHLQ